MKNKLKTAFLLSYIFLAGLVSTGAFESKDNNKEEKPSSETTPTIQTSSNTTKTITLTPES